MAGTAVLPGRPLVALADQLGELRADLVACALAADTLADQRHLSHALGLQALAGDVQRIAARLADVSRLHGLLHAGG